MNRGADSKRVSRWIRSGPALVLLGVVGAAVVLRLVVVADSGEAVEVPEFAVGVDGPAVIDETGLVAEWELVDPAAFEAGFANRLGRYTGEFGIDATTEESTEIVVSWSALPCQQAPVAQVTPAEGGLQVDVTPGPSSGDCAAMSVPYAFQLLLAKPLGDRSISATLTDPVNQRSFEYARRSMPP